MISIPNIIKHKHTKRSLIQEIKLYDLQKYLLLTFRKVILQWEWEWEWEWESSFQNIHTVIWAFYYQLEDMPYLILFCVPVFLSCMYETRWYPSWTWRPHSIFVFYVRVSFVVNISIYLTAATKKRSLKFKTVIILKSFTVTQFWWSVS